MATAVSESEAATATKDATRINGNQSVAGCCFDGLPFAGATLLPSGESLAAAALAPHNPAYCTIQA